jgi:hypothetical protein
VLYPPRENGTFRSREPRHSRALGQGADRSALTPRKRVSGSDSAGRRARASHRRREATHRILRDGPIVERDRRGDEDAAVLPMASGTTDVPTWRPMLARLGAIPGDRSSTIFLASAQHWRSAAKPDSKEDGAAAASMIAVPSYKGSVGLCQLHLLVLRPASPSTSLNDTERSRSTSSFSPAWVRRSLLKSPRRPPLLCHLPRYPSSRIAASTFAYAPARFNVRSCRGVRSPWENMMFTLYLTWLFRVQPQRVPKNDTCTRHRVLPNATHCGPRWNVIAVVHHVGSSSWTHACSVASSRRVRSPVRSRATVGLRAGIIYLRAPRMRLGPQNTGDQLQRGTQ